MKVERNGQAGTIYRETGNWFRACRDWSNCRFHVAYPLRWRFLSFSFVWTITFSHICSDRVTTVSVALPLPVAFCMNAALILGTAFNTLRLKIYRVVQGGLGLARVGAPSARLAFKLPLSSQSSCIYHMGNKVVRVLWVKLCFFFVINCSLLLSLSLLLLLLLLWLCTR